MLTGIGLNDLIIKWMHCAWTRKYRANIGFKRPDVNQKTPYIIAPGMLTMRDLD